MVSMQKAQTGKRVYGGVSQSPNMGQVSARGAQGYIKRELNNKNKNGPIRPVGGDGKSDRRSAVAAQALQRNSWGKPKSMLKAQGKGKSKPAAKPGAVASGGPVGAAQAPPAPTVKVSNTGMLELPYDQNYAADQYAAVGDANNELLAIQMEEQQNALDFAKATRDANLEDETTRKQTLSGAGGSGTVFSSQYGNQVATNATNYANKVAELTAKDAQFRSDAAMRRAAVQSSLSEQLSASTQGYGDELGDQAGTLGFGTATTPVVDRTQVAKKSLKNNTKGSKRPSRPSPKHVWRNGKWVKQ